MAFPRFPQAALPLAIEAPPSLAEFVPGANGEMFDHLLGALAQLGVHPLGPAGPQCAARIAPPSSFQVSPQYPLLHSPEYSRLHSPEYSQLNSPEYSQLNSPEYSQLHSPQYASRYAPPAAQNSAPGGPRSAHYAQTSLHVLHLWGGPGVGKTHLCEALQRAFAPNTAGTAADGSSGHASEADAAPSTPGVVVVEIHDDIDQLAPEDHPRLLGRFERLRSATHGLWLSTSRAPPGQLPVLADLRSRLSWGLVFELKALRDDALHDALRQWAQRRALPLAPEVLPWLLHHSERNLAHLLRILLRLDHYGLARQRSLSLPLLREMLQAAEDAHDTLP